MALLGFFCLNMSLYLYYLCVAGFPEIGQGKEETRTGKNKGNIWNQQRQVVKERKTVNVYLIYEVPKAGM